MKKRLLSLLLAMVMIVTMLPLQALAEEADETPALIETEELMIEEITDPVEETEAPVQETEAPVEETEAPEEETEAPEEETEAPVEETEAPVEETEAPVEETEAPVEETEAPVEETEAPVEETEAPEDEVGAQEEAAEDEREKLYFLLSGTDPNEEPKTIDSITLKAGESVVLTVVDESGNPVQEEPMYYVGSPSISLIRDVSSLTVIAEDTAKQTTVTIYCGLGPVLSADTAAQLKVTVIPRPVITLLAPKNTEELSLPAGSSIPLDAKLSTADQNNDGIDWTVRNKDGSECTVAEIKRNEDDTLVLQAADTAEALTMVTVTASQVIPEGYTEDTIAYPVSFDVTIGNPLVLKITNMPETITMGSKSLTLKVADLEGNPYKGKLTWEMETLRSNDSNLLPVVATLSSNGVLKSSVGLSHVFPIRVRAIGADLRRTEWVSVALVPPVESFYVYWGIYSPDPQNGEAAPDGAVKRKDPVAQKHDIADGDIYLCAYGFLPIAARQEVSWSIQVSSKVATWKYDEDGTPVIHPITPGKLTYTATAKDGSGAKYTGSIEFTGKIRQLEFEHTGIPTVKGGQSYTFRVKAWYDDAKTLPVANPQVSWKYNGNQANASINSKGVLTVSKNISVVDGGAVEAICDGSRVTTVVRLRPADDLTPWILCEDPATGRSWVASGLYVPAGTELKISGKVFDANAMDTTPVTPTSVTVKGAAYNKETGILTVGSKEDTKVTITASFNIDGATKKTSLWFWVGHEADCVDVTTDSAPSGKTTRLSAVSRYQEGDDWKNCSQQKFTWVLHNTSKELRGKTKLTKDGKLTVPKLDRPGWVFVGVKDSYGCGNSFTIQIEPVKQVKPTVEFYGWYDYFNGDTNTVAVNLLNPENTCDLDVDSDYKVSVLIDGEDYEGNTVTVTDITSSKESIAAPVYDEETLELEGFKFTGKTGSVVFTFRGEVNTGVEGAEPVPFTKAVTVKAVKAVTEVTLNGPLVGTVGKSLNLKPVVNKDASNKKLNWEIEDVDGVYDKTSIKNGVIKFDGSFYSEARTYTVICRSADGFYENQWTVTAEAAANAIYIFDADSPRTLFNGTTQTITRGQTLRMDVGAVTPGDLVPHETMTAKSSNPKVAAVYKMQVNGSSSEFFWIVQGLKPGTATITFTANSGKKASFKVVVSKEVSDYFEVTGLKPLQDNLITKKVSKFEISLHTVYGEVIKFDPANSHNFFYSVSPSENWDYFETDIDEQTGMLTITSPNYDPNAPLRRMDLIVSSFKGSVPCITVIPFVTRSNIPVNDINPG